MQEQEPKPDSYIDIVFVKVEDGDSYPDYLFVEVEDEEGRSISVGEWVRREDNYIALRIPRERTIISNELQETNLQR